MHTYKIVEQNEDPKQVVIEKGGITAEFTLQDVESEQRALEKHLKEFYAQMDLEEKKIANIEQYHPFVKDLTEQECFTVHMYQESKAIVHVLKKKIPEFEEQMQKSKEEEREIKENLGLKTEEEIVDEAVAKIVEL